MENIFTRLQVSSPAAAITRAFPDRATLMGADPDQSATGGYTGPPTRSLRNSAITRA
jgi:hypothetical protein